MNVTFAGAALAFSVAVLVTRLAADWSRNRRLLDEPTDRSAHTVPTPRIGGLGIVAGALAGFGITAVELDAALATVIVASLVLGAVGLIDDLRRVSALAKYLAQLGAAAAIAITVAPVLRVDLFDAELEIAGLAAVVLTTIWLTAIANAFNFMDGADGFMGGVTVLICVAGLSIVAAPAAPLVTALAAATLGFLIWNHAPASIFMGDVGSQFLGLIVGGVLLLDAGGSVRVIPLLLLMAPLLFDTGFTLIWRARAGRNLFAAHREHLYQRLITSGTEHRTVAAAYAVATAVCGVAALGWSAMAGPGQGAFLIGAAIVGAGYVAFVRRSEARAARATG